CLRTSVTHLPGLYTVREKGAGGMRGPHKIARSAAARIPGIFGPLAGSFPAGDEALAPRGAADASSRTRSPLQRPPPHAPSRRMRRIPPLALAAAAAAL